MMIYGLNSEQNYCSKSHYEQIQIHTPYLSFPFPPPHIPDEFYSEEENEAAAQAEAQALYIPQVGGLDDATVIAGQDHIWHANAACSKNSLIQKRSCNNTTMDLMKMKMKINTIMKTIVSIVICL